MLGKSVLHAWPQAVLLTVHKPDYANKAIKRQKE